MSTANIEIVERLQNACKDAFVGMMVSVEAGMSEKDIADVLRDNLAGLGITNHWYDVPFNVLIGVQRFRIGTTTTDYGVKSPSPHVQLEEGNVVYVDFSPMDPETGIWGDWSSTFVFRPQTEAAKRQVAFLETMRRVHCEGIPLIDARTTGAEVVRYYIDMYAKQNSIILDVRKNVGHSMHLGPKKGANRIWLDLENNNPLGSGIFTIEPGGMSSDEKMVARFEDCIFIPAVGAARIVGPAEPVPVSI